MWQRVRDEKSSSSMAHFRALTLMGELTVKVVTSGLLAAVQEDRERTRYRLNYHLVRANGIGIWSSTIQTLVSSQVMSLAFPRAHNDFQELMRECTAGTWQYECVSRLNHCLKAYPETRALERCV
jgi:hypothetical protein